MFHLIRIQFPTSATHYMTTTLVAMVSLVSCAEFGPDGVNQGLGDFHTDGTGNIHGLRVQLIPEFLIVLDDINGVTPQLISYLELTGKTDHEIQPFRAIAVNLLHFFLNFFHLDPTRDNGGDYRCDENTDFDYET